VGASFKDRQDLLGHGSAPITTHYSAAELPRLIAEAGPDEREWHAEYFPETCVIASSPRLKNNDRTIGTSAHDQIKWLAP